MVYQMERNECGLACIVMIASHFGIETELRSLRNQTDTGHCYTNIRQLIQLAGTLGLNGRALQLELDDLHSLETPALLHWNLDHFVVLNRRKGKSFIIHDPAVGIRTYSCEEVSRHFTGIALSFTRASQLSAATVTPKLRIRELLGGYSRHFGDITQVFFLSLAVQVLALLSPIYLQLVIDQGITKGDMDLVVVVAILFTAVAVTRAAVSYLRSVIVMQFSNRLGFELVENAYRHLLSLPMGFFERREMGDIVSRFGALDNIKQLVSQDMITVTVDGLFSVLTLILLYFYSPLLATISAIGLILVSLLRLFTVAAEMNRRNESLVAGAKQQSIFMENIRSITVTKAYGLSEVRLPDWENAFCRSINSGYHLGLFQLRIGTAQTLLYALENVLVVYFGATLINAGELTIGQLLGFIFLKQHFATAVTVLFPKLAELRLMRLELDRVADILLTSSEDSSSPKSLHRPSLDGEMEVRNLQYSYASDGQPILTGVNCKIAAGQVLTICGPSGSGKSTLLKILAGMERDYRGEILISNKPLQEYDSTHYRENISIVHHDDKLIVGDIAFNIHLDKDPGNTERMQLACDRACIRDVIERLPNGYGSKVGEMGEFLSAGQIQRVLIARALYRQPRLLFLDESLSHLSDELAMKIVASIRAMGVTLFLVTHNASLRKTADQVLDL